MKSMIKTALVMALGCSLSAVLAADAPAPTTSVRVAPDRKNGIYKAGDPITFRISVTHESKALTRGTIQYRLFMNGMPTATNSIELTETGAVVTTSLPLPGIVAVFATYSNNGTLFKGQVGAAVDPFVIKPALPPPADFDAFWEAQKKKLATVPMNPRLKKVKNLQQPPYGPTVECFDVELDCIGGRPVYGYYAKPVNAKPKSLPAILSLHSAGVRSAGMPVTNAKRTMLALDINAHGLPNGQPREFYGKLRDGELAGYAHKGLGSPETYYFYGMYVRMVRAIDFLTSQPEWDGKILIASGGSQGGGQALVVSGLDNRVTEVNAVVPAFCDLNGFIEKRAATYGSTITTNTTWQKTMTYYDACYFASRSRAKVSLEVGLVDQTCPPAGILAAFNQLKGEKQITILPPRDHGGSIETSRMVDDPAYTHKL